MSPVAVTRETHHLPGLAVDRRCNGPRQTAFGVEADGARGKGGGRRLAAEQLPGRRVGIVGLGKWWQRLGSDLGFWKCGAQNRGKERHLVDASRQSGDELFQAVV